MPGGSGGNPNDGYNYNMGFSVMSGNDMIPLPDPAAFTATESNLDTMGERDATGYLHRKMVATKHPIKLEYNGLKWEKIVEICQLLNYEKLTFTFPDPFSTDAVRTIEAYVGDRETECRYAPDDGQWYGDLKFSVIEY